MDYISRPISVQEYGLTIILVAKRIIDTLVVWARKAGLCLSVVEVSSLALQRVKVVEAQAKLDGLPTIQTLINSSVPNSILVGTGVALRRYVQ